jgi:tRNA pseudouridine38-40 synthase
VVYRLIVSYRGTAYAGWQRQENALTVQQVLEEALARLLGSSFPAPFSGATGFTVVGASRTDAGVHARGQAVHLVLPGPFPPGGLVQGTNHHLPEDVRVLAAEAMPEGFHARKHAIGKEYHYRLSRAAVLSPLDSPFVVRVDPRIDLGRLAAATARLPGRHDFSAFAAAGGSHRQPFRRIFTAEWGTPEDASEEIRFRVVGDGFLRGMVRALVGTLVDVGLGRRSMEDLALLLGGGVRSAAGPTAPAHGLVLARVLYPAEEGAISAEPYGTVRTF